MNFIIACKVQKFVKRYPATQRIFQAYNMGRKQDSEESSPRKPSGRLPAGQWSYGARYSCVLDPRINGNVGTKIDIDIPPDRHELFLLDDGEKKVEYDPETRKSRL